MATPENVSAANLAILCGMARHKKAAQGWIYYEMTKVPRSAPRITVESQVAKFKIVGSQIDKSQVAKFKIAEF
jgi:hypothetical protein